MNNDDDDDEMRLDLILNVQSHIGALLHSSRGMAAAASQACRFGCQLHISGLMPGVSHHMEQLQDEQFLRRLEERLLASSRRYHQLIRADA